MLLPVSLKGDPAFLARTSQSLYIQLANFNGFRYRLDRKAGFIACIPIGLNATVIAHSHQRRLRRQRSGIDEVDIRHAAFCLSATDIFLPRRPEPFFVSRQMRQFTAAAASEQIGRVKIACGALVWMALRNDMFDLTIVLLEVDLTITAKAMLKACQSINKLAATFGVAAAEPSPSRRNSCVSEIAGKAGSRTIQYPNGLHSDLPTFSSNVRRRISISALSSA